MTDKVVALVRPPENDVTTHLRHTVGQVSEGGALVGYALIVFQRGHEPSMSIHVGTTGLNTALLAHCASEVLVSCCIKDNE